MSPLAGVPLSRCRTAPWAAAVVALVCGAVGVLRPSPAAAQVGEATDIITGVVTDSLGNPLAGVIIEALSLETQITRTTQTNARGRFTLLFPDGGGQYRMTARRIGMAPVQAILVRYADEDRLVWDVRMSTQPFLLDPIQVEARLRPVLIPDPPSPGSTERNLTPDAVAALPIEPEDLNVLATLVPGVVELEETDSTEATFSVAGQRPDANAITLDGMTFGSGNVPQDGLRRTRVVTGTYDVARGRFSGGLIAATTRSGTNRFQGSGNYALRDDDLAFSSEDQSAFTSGFTLHRVSGGLGGPILRNRMFFFFSAQGRLRNDPLAALSTARPEDLERLGVAPDSVARFREITDGLVASPLAFGDGRSNDNLSALLRLDYLLTNDHTLTLRGDWRGTQQDPSRVPRLGLPEAGGVTENGGNGLMARLASRIGLSLLNQFQVYVAGSRREGDPFLQYTPQGRVQVASTLPDGSTGIRTLVFGGNTQLPITSHETTLEVANELSWLPGSGRHRVKVGGLVTARSASEVLSSNQFGTYTYGSLTALENDRARSYRRTLAPRERDTRSIEYAAYVGDVWRASRALQVTFGVRLEGSILSKAPPLNPDLASALGVRTDRLPSEIFLSPRAGFTLLVGTPARGGRPDWIVRGGIGAFRSPIPTQLISLTQAATGLSTSEAQITCAGPGVPAPDWPAYGTDPSMIPDACVGAGVLRPQLPNATVFDPAFGAPKAWRGSIGVQRSLTGFLRASVDLVYARGVSQYGFTDLNLNTDGGFTVPNEANRPVFVDPNAIVPATGDIRLADSRRDPAFGQVLQIDSDLGSETTQATVGLAGFTRGGIRLQASYTWQRVRDQSSASVRLATAAFGSSTTAGNPNLREWSRGSFERRHAFLTTVSVPVGRSLEITAIGRLTSGVPYTPMVADDINGDGARNDRAFVFSPDDASPAVADGMQRLLASTSAGARACLERQLGRIAERNSCVGPWQTSFDLQVNYRPRMLGLNGRLQLSVVTVNLLRGIDELFHGADNAKGWGLRARPDGTLLFVTGFDPATRQFTYAVNERFGDSRVGAASRIAPFQIGFQARFWIGPNRQQDAIDRLRRGGGGRGRGQVRPGAVGRGGFGGLGTPEEFLDRFRTLFPNPPELILEMRDSLQLSDEQVRALRAAADTLRARNDSVATELRAELEAIGANDPQELVAAMRPRAQIARLNVQRAVRAVREILTEEQWAMLPEAWRRTPARERIRE